VVLVKDVAYVTYVAISYSSSSLFLTKPMTLMNRWKALVFYLTTSQLTFAPLSAHGSARPRGRTVMEKATGIPSKPSAKSMYRLGDKVYSTSIPLSSCVC